tara:strand:- start:6176 stop:6892 length:717 start_codon:yes stop_codon:yes gene_type:complete
MQPSLEHSIWFEEQNFAFIYLPKVACTSWKLHLWQASGHAIPADLEYSDVHNPKRLALPYVDQMAREQQQAFLHKLDLGQLTAMAVIRDPRSRVLSAYLDKILFHSNPLSKFSRNVLPAIQTCFGLVAEQRPSFEQFLRWNQAELDARRWNPHWRPMVHLLGHTKRLQLWPMEQLDSAVQAVNKRFNCNLSFPKQQVLGPRQTYKSQTQLEQYYGPLEQTLVNEMYRDDLELHAALVA